MPPILSEQPTTFWSFNEDKDEYLSFLEEDKTDRNGKSSPEESDSYAYEEAYEDAIKNIDNFTSFVKDIFASDATLDDIQYEDQVETNDEDISFSDDNDTFDSDSLISAERVISPRKEHNEQVNVFSPFTTAVSSTFSHQ